MPADPYHIPDDDADIDGEIAQALASANPRLRPPRRQIRASPGQNNRTGRMMQEQ